MIIDFHAHIFPPKIAEKATKSIGDFYNLEMSYIGTPEELVKSGSKIGVSKYIVHSTATKAMQVESINNYIIDELIDYPEFVGYGTIHPDYDNFENELKRIKAEGKKTFFIGIENAYGVGSTLKDIQRVKDLGVTYITLCHTKNNDYCDSSSDKEVRWNGLSPFGKKAIKEMNRLGVMIDVSHASEKTFWDVIKYSKKPIIEHLNQAIQSMQI